MKDSFNFLFRFFYHIHKNKLKLILFIMISFIIVMIFSALAHTLEILDTLTLFYKIILFPFEIVGGGLRTLSLSSNVGNILAILLFILVSMSPITFYLIRNFKNQKVNKKSLVLNIGFLLLMIVALVMKFSEAIVFSISVIGVLYMTIKKIKTNQKIDGIFYLTLTIFLGITLYLFINPSLIPSQLDRIKDYLSISTSINQELKVYIEQSDYIYKTSLVYTLLLLVLMYLGFNFYRFTRKNTIHLFTISTILLTILKLVYISMFVFIFILTPAIKIYEIGAVSNREESNIKFVNSDYKESSLPQPQVNSDINYIFKNMGLESPENSHTVTQSELVTYQQVNLIIEVIFDYIFFLLVLIVLRKLYQLLTNFKNEQLFIKENVNLLQSVSSLIALIMLNQLTNQFINNCYQLLFIKKLPNTRFILDLPLNNIIFALAFYSLSLIIKQSYEIYDEQRLTI